MRAHGSCQAHGSYQAPVATDGLRCTYRPIICSGSGYLQGWQGSTMGSVELTAVLCTGVGAIVLRDGFPYIVWLAGASSHHTIAAFDTETVDKGRYKRCFSLQTAPKNPAGVSVPWYVLTWPCRSVGSCCPCCRRQ